MRISAHDNIEQLRHKLRLKDYLPIQDRIRADAATGGRGQKKKRGRRN